MISILPMRLFAMLLLIRKCVLKSSSEYCSINELKFFIFSCFSYSIPDELLDVVDEVWDEIDDSKRACIRLIS